MINEDDEEEKQAEYGDRRAAGLLDATGLAALQAEFADIQFEGEDLGERMGEEGDEGVLDA